jgi:MFS family permease
MYTVGNIYLIAAVAVIGGGLFGFDISSMSAIIGTEQYRCYFNQSPDPNVCSGPRANVQGGIVAAMAGGSWIGALTSGFLSDILGRNKAVRLGAVIWYVLWVGESDRDKDHRACSIIAKRY